MEKDYLTLILTRRCKEDCPFCFIDKKDVSLKEETAKKTLEFFLNNGGEEKTIKFFGGEPLLEFSLLKNIVGFCRDRGKTINKRINFILSTSGTILNDRILHFINLHEIELVIDSFHIRKIKKEPFRNLFSLPFLTLTINISPGSVINLFIEFKKFYDQGFRRFNFLPFYYTEWPDKSIITLKKEFDKIKTFYQESPGLYFKNCDLQGDIPLFNSCLTCDTSGDLYSSNIILFKNFSKFKSDFFITNIHKLDAGNELKIDNKQLLSAIKKSFPKKALRDTFAIDNTLNAFVESLQRPIKVADVKLGNSCNNRCKFCVRRKKGQEHLNKTTGEIKENLRNARFDCQGVIFTGGESSIRKDFFELISYARRLGYEKIQIQTNGRMFAYRSFCIRAIEAGANEFGIAIHGHIPQLHDYLTSSPGSFYQTVQAIKNIKELNQPIFTNTVINKSNYRHLPQIAQLLVNLGVDQFQFAFVHALGSAGENFESVVPRISMVMPYVKKGLDIGIKAGIRVMSEAIPYCLMGEYYRDYISEKIIPSTKIFELTNEVIDFDNIRSRLAKAKGGDCKKCEYFYVCEGTWREYPERFGWGEFKPVMNKKQIQSPEDIVDVKINITEDCVLNCKYCFHKHEHIYFKKELVEPLIRFLKGPEKEVSIDYFGGEPILNFNIIKHITEECKNQGVKIRNFNLTTNGVLLTDTKKIDYLAKNKFIISFSIDGPADVHLKNRKSNRFNIDSHKIIIRAIKYMNDKGYPYNIAAVFHKNTINNLEESVNFLLALTGDYKKIIIKPTIGFTWQKKDFVLLKNTLNRLTKRNPQNFQIYREILCKQESDFICRAIYIDHYGYVYPTNLFSYKNLRCKKINLATIEDPGKVMAYLKKEQLKLRHLKYDKEMKGQFEIIRFINKFFGLAAD